MPFSGAEIIGIHGVEIVRDARDSAGDALVLRLVLDDGTVAQTWWPLKDMARFCSRIGTDLRSSVALQ